MRIMVFDVPAVSGGALTVLYDFYDEYKLNQENEYIFVLSLPELIETKNIKVIRYPWIKKSWFHRLYFDHFIAPTLIKKLKVDKVLSLQNTDIPHTKVFQSLFVHNALPFSEYQFRFNENKFLWLYQNVIGRRIKKSIKRSSEVIVQTEWMKNSFINEIGIKKEKVIVKAPRVDIKINSYFEKTKSSLSTFFYPASSFDFKNHKVIVEACKTLKNDGITDYKIIFTLYGNENDNIKRLYEDVTKYDLPIEFIGTLAKNEVYNYYCKSILLFSSYIETVGLPLLEAMEFNTPIIVADLRYSRNVLKEYPNVNYFQFNNALELSEIIKEYKTISDNISTSI